MHHFWLKAFCLFFTSLMMFMGMIFSEFTLFGVV